MRGARCRYGSRLLNSRSKLLKIKRSAPLFQIILGIEMPEDRDQDCNQSGPPGLMTGADAGTVVAVKILVEQQMVPPMRIGLELLRATKDRPASCTIAQENASQPVGNFAGYLE